MKAITDFDSRGEIVYPVSSTPKLLIDSEPLIPLYALIPVLHCDYQSSLKRKSSQVPYKCRNNHSGQNSSMIDDEIPQLTFFRSYISPVGLREKYRNQCGHYNDKTLRNCRNYLICWHVCGVKREFNFSGKYIWMQSYSYKYKRFMRRNY